MKSNFGLDAEKLSLIKDVLQRYPKFDVTDYHRVENKALKEHIDQYGKVIYEKKDM